MDDVFFIFTASEMSNQPERGEEQKPLYLDDPQFVKGLPSVPPLAEGSTVTKGD